MIEIEVKEIYSLIKDIEKDIMKLEDYLETVENKEEKNKISAQITALENAVEAINKSVNYKNRFEVMQDALDLVEEVKKDMPPL
jgi:cob(I)alamin adenosyltransferase